MAMSRGSRDLIQFLARYKLNTVFLETRKFYVKFARDVREIVKE